MVLLALLLLGCERPDEPSCEEPNGERAVPESGETGDTGEPGETGLYVYSC